MPRVAGAIIAGGDATRLGGRPKGLERVGGIRMLDRLADAMAEGLGVAPLLVANAAEAGTWRPGLRVIRDRRPGAGALGGIYTAVVEAPAPVVCVAWDMPFVTAELVRALAEGLDDWDAFLPESHRGRQGVEPLCAVYGPACGPAIEARLAAGDLRAVGFHDGLRIGRLPLDAVRRIGDPGKLFFNVNTADDLARADAL